MKKETIDRIRRFTEDRDWDQFHTPANLAKSISIEANELLECFQWSDTEYDLDHVREELADVIVYCQNMLDKLGLDVDEIVNSKMDQNEAKYPVSKSKGNAAKYDRLDGAAENLSNTGDYDLSAAVFFKTEDQLSKARRYLKLMQDLDKYDLDPDEHNMALMLLHLCKTTPKEYVSFEVQQLQDLIDKSAKSFEKRDELRRYYKIVRRSFTSALNKERRSMGTNDTALVAEHKGNHSASHVLMMFKQDEDKAMEAELFGRDPNLGNVRRVDIDKLVREHSKQYLRFLEDWRQTCRSETTD